MAEKRVLPFSFINILLWIPLILFVVPGALILWLWKKFIETLVTKLVKPDNFRPPNSLMDMTMCQGSSYQLPNTNAAQVWVVRGESWISSKEFADHFHKVFLEGNSEKYRNLYAHVTTYGTYAFYAHCKPQELDLSWHIREYDLKDYGHGTLESWAVTWMTTNTYEEGRPVWQIAILHLGSADQDGIRETGIVAKFSHSLIDGYSFVHMVGKLTDNPAPYIVKERTFNWKEKLKYIYQAPEAVLSTYADMAFSSDSKSPFRKEGRSSSIPKRWFMSFATLNLDTVKLLRKTTDTHFVCLMMSAQIGAIRRLMLETKKESELPENIWNGSSMPWPQHPLALTNHWCMGFFKCPLRLADPLQRLKWLEAYYQDFTQNEVHVKGFYTLAPLLRILPAWARRVFCHYDFALTNSTLFFASLMLSSRKHYLLGREVKNLYLPLACPDVIPVSLYGVTTSHSGQIDLSIAAANPVVKSQEEMDRLTQVYFTQELDAIAALTALNSCTTNSVANSRPYKNNNNNILIN